MNLQSLKSWGAESVQAVREEGLSGLDAVWRPAYYKLLHQVERFQDPGVSIYDFDWDVCIILDACRYDLMTEVADQYEFLNTVEQRRSVDSMTPAWMRRTFVEERVEEMAETYYLCANPFSEEILDEEDFAELDEIWKYAWDDDTETVLPETVTDRCINISRERDPERLLVHYIQPHWPFVPAMDLTKGSGLRPVEFGGYNKSEVWERLRRGEVSSDEVWDGYRDNLTCALDSVEILLENLEAKSVVITSDHGNAFGEYGVYGHPMHMPLDSLRTVPHVRTTAVDRETRQPETIETIVASDDIKGELEALGYK
jgi:hypothetical protein